MSKFYDFLRAHLRFFLYIKKRRKQSAIEIGDFMAEDLQNLIDRIQNEAVAKADAQSAEIIAKAQAKAASIVKDAEAQAKANLEKADKDAEVYAERSKKALEQAARDVLISVGRSLESMVNGILSLQVEKNLSDATVKEMLLALAKNYASSETEVVFSDADKAKLTSFATGEFAKALGAGVQVSSDSGVKFGFRLKLDGGKVSNEFTSQSIAAALSAIVRPEIAKVVSDVAQGK